MAVTPFKTFVAGEVLTASDLNSSITTITNGGMSLVSPATATLDMDGNKIILDADADTSITADTDDQIDFEAGGFDAFRVINNITGGTNRINIYAANTAVAPRLEATGDANAPLIVRSAGTGDLTLDAAGLELLILDPQSTAINELTIRNAAASANPSIRATGDDTNIGIALVPKGTGGTVRIEGLLNISNATTMQGNLSISDASVSFNDREDLASSTSGTTDIGATASNYIRITGTNTITAFGTPSQGGSVFRHILFGGALTFTHNATSLILPGNGSNITTVAGDTCLAIHEGSGNWRVVDYVRASGASVVAASSAFAFVSNTTIGSSATVDIQSLASGYDYLFQLTALSVATDDVALFMRVEEGAAWQADATDYAWENVAQTADASDSEIDISAAAGSTVAFSNATNETATIEVMVPNVGASVRKNITFNGGHVTSGTADIYSFVIGVGAYITNTNAITGVRFLASSGNLNSGTLTVWRRQRS